MREEKIFFSSFFLLSSRDVAMHCSTYVCVYIGHHFRCVCVTVKEIERYAISPRRCLIFSPLFYPWEIFTGVHFSTREIHPTLYLLANTVSERCCNSRNYDLRGTRHPDTCRGHLHLYPWLRGSLTYLLDNPLVGRLDKFIPYIIRKSLMMKCLQKKILFFALIFIVLCLCEIVKIVI